jgi:hypothetical protein
MSFKILPAVDESKVPEPEVGTRRKYEEIVKAARQVEGKWLPISFDTAKAAWAFFHSVHKNNKGDGNYLKGIRARKRIARGSNMIFVSWKSTAPKA